MKSIEEYASEAIAAFAEGVSDEQFRHIEGVVRQAVNDALDAAAGVVWHEVDGPLGKLPVGDEDAARRILKLRVESR